VPVWCTCPAADPGILARASGCQPDAQPQLMSAPWSRMSTYLLSGSRCETMSPYRVSEYDNVLRSTGKPPHVGSEIEAPNTALFVCPYVPVKAREW